MFTKTRSLVAGLVLAAAAVLATGTSANAAVTFHSGPTFTDNGTTLTVVANASGLGSAPVTATLSTTGTADVTCTNPAGNVAPGQSTQVTTTASPYTFTPHNGRASFTLTTAEPTAPSNACPNSKWTASVTDVHFTSATLTLTQSGQTIFQQTYQL